jgi:hypothetical protein
MKKPSIIQFISCCCILTVLTSCATIMNGDSHAISIRSDMPDASVVFNNMEKVKAPGAVAVIRSENDLPVRVMHNDTIVNDTVLSPKLSDRFSVVNLCFALYGSYLIDLTNDRRFTYGRYIYVDSAGCIETHHTAHRYFSNKYADYYLNKPKSGDVNLLLAIPEFNFFHLHPATEPVKNMSGCIGLGIGAEYYYKDNRSLQLRWDHIQDFPVFVPAPYDWDESEPWERGFANNFSLTDNFRWKRFQTGYGLNLARNTWLQHTYYIKPDPEEIVEDNTEPEWVDGQTKTNTMLGLSLNTYYRFTEHFYFGIIYRPSFWDISNSRLRYEHSISIDFMWKVYLK